MLKAGIQEGMALLPEAEVVVAGGKVVAAQGVKMLVANTPASVIRFGYWLTHKANSLRDNKSMQAFDSLYQVIKSLNSDLPGTVSEFEKQFLATKAFNCVYVFSNETCFSIATLIKAMYRRENYDGRLYRDCFLRDEIITHLQSLPSLKDGEGQTRQKIFFGYIASLALELPYLQTDNRKLELIEHLQTVVVKVKERPTFGRYFKQKEREVFAKLISSFEAFIHEKNAKHQSNQLKDAITTLKDNQSIMAVSAWRLLMLLTEGGDKDFLSLSAKDIENNIASRTPFTDKTQPFQEDNPFLPLIGAVASLLPDIQRKYTRSINYETLYVPQLESIATYLKAHLRSDYHLFGRNAASPIAFYLNATVINGKAVEISSLKEEKQVEAAINKNAEALHKVAKWLRYHILVADKIASLEFLLDRCGDHWFRSVSGLQETQQLIRIYQGKIETFNADMTALKDFLSARHTDCRTSKYKADSTIIMLISQEMVNNATFLSRSFKKIQAPGNLADIERAIASELTQFFGWIENPTAQAFPESIQQRFKMNLIMQPPKGLNVVKGEDDNVADICDTLNYIQSSIVNYASDSPAKYKFYAEYFGEEKRIPIPEKLLLRKRPKLGRSYSLSSFSTLSSDAKLKYEARAIWLFNCLRVLFSNGSHALKLQQLKVLVECTEIQREYFDNPALISLFAFINQTQQSARVLHQPGHAVAKEVEIMPIEKPQQKVNGIKNDAIVIEADELEVVQPILPSAKKVEAVKPVLPNALPEKKYKKIGHYRIPEQSSQTIKNLAVLISSGFPKGNVNDRSTKLFIPFWVDLCLLGQTDILDNVSSHWRQTNKMETYQSLSRSIKLSKAEQDYLVEIESALAKKHLKQWAQDSVTQLRDTYSHLKLERLADKKVIIKVKRHLLNQSADLREKRRTLLVSKLGIDNSVAWPYATFDKLKNDVFWLAGNALGARKKVKYFIERMSGLLLRNESNMLNACDYEALDIMLNDALGKGRRPMSAGVEALSSPWLVLAQGLVRLGASPLAWMNKQQLAGKGKPAFQSENVFFMMGQVTQSILTTLILRAGYSGESSVLLGEFWGRYFSATHAFASRLHEYSESTQNVFLSYLWWPTMQVLGAQNPQETIGARIKIFWSLLSFANTVISAKLESSITIDRTLSNGLTKLKISLGAFKTESAQYRSIGMMNRGTQSASSLFDVLVELQAKMSRLGSLREQKALLVIESEGSNDPRFQAKLRARAEVRTAAFEEKAKGLEKKAKDFEEQAKGLEKKHSTRFNAKTANVFAALLVKLESQAPKITKAQFILNVVNQVFEYEAEADVREFTPSVTAEVKKHLAQAPSKHSFFALPPAVKLGRVGSDAQHRILM